MNNTFSFDRFRSLLLKDGKMYLRNFGITLIVLCNLSTAIWVMDFLVQIAFGNFDSHQIPSELRYGVIIIATLLGLLMVPSRVYGKVNQQRDGVAFAMLPASSLEKFLSMFVYCMVVSPILLFFGSYLTDTFLSILPFGSYDEITRLNIIDTFSINKPTWADSIFFILFPYFWISLYMLGNTIFKRRSAGKTFGCLMGTVYLFSTYLGLLANAFDWNFPGFRTFLVIIMFLLTGLFLFFTYLKIKTQKY